MQSVLYDVMLHITLIPYNGLYSLGANFPEW